MKQFPKLKSARNSDESGFMLVEAAMGIAIAALIIASTMMFYSAAHKARLARFAAENHGATEAVATQASSHMPAAAWVGLILIVIIMGATGFALNKIGMGAVVAKASVDDGANSSKTVEDTQKLWTLAEKLQASTATLLRELGNEMMQALAVASPDALGLLHSQVGPHMEIILLAARANSPLAPGVQDAVEIATQAFKHARLSAEEAAVHAADAQAQEAARAMRASLMRDA